MAKANVDSAKRGGTRAPRSKKASAKAASGASESKAFREAQARAAAIVADGRKAAALAARAQKKLGEVSGVSEVVDDLQTLIEMIRAYAKGEYREVPWTTVVAATAAIVYFVNPVDAIPDPLPGVGYVDDVTVTLFVLAAIDADLNSFRGWQEHGTGLVGGSRSAGPRN